MIVNNMSFKLDTGDIIQTKDKFGDLSIVHHYKYSIIFDVTDNKGVNEKITIDGKFHTLRFDLDKFIDDHIEEANRIIERRRTNGY